MLGTTRRISRKKGENEEEYSRPPSERVASSRSIMPKLSIHNDYRYRGRPSRSAILQPPSTRNYTCSSPVLLAPLTSREKKKEKERETFLFLPKSRVSDRTSPKLRSFDANSPVVPKPCSSSLFVTIGRCISQRFHKPSGQELLPQPECYPLHHNRRQLNRKLSQGRL